MSVNDRARPSKLARFNEKYIGDRAFYMTVIAIVLPIVIQNSISNFVNLLDNIMMGAVSTEQMSGVSIGNQLIFVYSLCIFGGVSAATIFGAQFHGAGDTRGVRDTFRYSLCAALLLTVAAAGVFMIWGDKLIMLYINDAQNVENAQETFAAGKAYLECMLWGLAPFAISQAYASMLRATGETKLPMYASITGVLVNLALNYILIFGHLGFPPLKARGAAIATVVARFVEMSVIVVFAHARARSAGKYKFLEGAYKRFRVPAKLFRSITVKGLPLLMNEAMWAAGMATLARQYSMRGLVVVAANNITSTLTNLFNVFFLSMGTAASVMIGQALGANDAKRARLNANRIICLQIMICIGVGLLLFTLAPLLPRLYVSADADVRALATALIRVCACAMPLTGFAHCCYFILRSGGRTGITFLFDSVYTWLLPVPMAFILVRYTDLNIVVIYLLCHAPELLKDSIGYVLVKKGVWIRNIVT